MSRLYALALALLLAACSVSSKSGKQAASADNEPQEASSEPSAATSTEEEESEFKDPKKEKLPEGPNCLDGKGDVQQCMQDSDCCKGFYCGIDPAGSTRIKVCLYGG